MLNFTHPLCKTLLTKCAIDSLFLVLFVALSIIPFFCSIESIVY